MSSSVTLYEGDNRETLRRLIAKGVRVHSVVCDPPYGLVSTAKRFGSESATPAKFGTDGAFKRASSGFMGSKWDATGIERDPEFWRLIWEILLPGGMVLAFSSPRTGHWQAVAMELAGFIIHPFKGWVYGQGFPKASNAQRAIDVQLCQLPGRHYESVLPSDARDGDHICPCTPEGAQWVGWGYGGQAEKPALEPIYVGQRPFSEKNGALNLLKHGVGAINIDECRVGVEDCDDIFAKNPHTAGGYGHAGADIYDPKKGRHPANLLHDGSPEVVALFPDVKGQIARSSRKTQNTYGEMRRGLPEIEMEPRGDSGSAARFFNSFPFDGDPICYHPKATKADRAGSKHPTVKPIGLMRWLVRQVTPPGGTVLDPFAGSGTTGAAAQLEGFDCILMEAEPKYLPDIRRRFGLACPSSEFDAILGAETELDFDDVLG